jgi:uncharacterized membrane protein SpoIIM required for sporulation
MVSWSGEDIVISARWLEKHGPHWKRLEELLGHAGRAGASALAHRELQELALLYRQAASDLSVVREDATSGRVTLYLNQLLGRAHNIIYMSRKPHSRGLRPFFLETFPEIFHETFSYTFAAFVIFLGAAVAGVLMCMANPGFERYLLGPDMMDTIAQHKMWTHSIVSVKPLASSQIMTNNISVSLVTFALGITAGIGTVWMLIFNGLLFGVVNAACWDAHMCLMLWSFVAPHGVLELPAIFIAGGAGLLLARGMLFPGHLPHGASIELAGAKAVRLVLGMLPILVLAGIVEGFISPSDLNPALKFSLAGALAVLLVVYLSRKKRLRICSPTAGSAPSLPNID